MNLPNILTILRIILTGAFIVLIGQEGTAPKLAAAVVFLLASVTDCLDGHIARKYNLVTTFGKIMDPIADKFLMLAAFFVFAQMEFFAWWMFIVIAIREIGITLIRLVYLRKGKALAAEELGKYKTIAQVFIIYFMLIYLLISEAGYLQNIDPELWYYSIYGMMFAVVFLTIYSGFSFLKNNFSMRNV